MRIDLGLQHPQFRFFQRLLLFHFGLKQLLDFANHYIKADTQVFNLIHIIAGNKNLQVILGDGSGHIMQFFNGGVNSSGNEPGGGDRKHQRRADENGGRDSPPVKSLAHLLILFLRAGNLK